MKIALFLINNGVDVADLINIMGHIGTCTTIDGSNIPNTAFMHYSNIE